MRRPIVFALLLIAGAAQAQYKYIGPDGRTVYSDQPPPPGAKVLEKKVPGGSSSGGDDMPAAIQSAMKTFPVILYTAPNCGAPCSDGRNLLTQRGIPFTEKVVKTQEDNAAFQRQVNSAQLPVLLVGSGKQPQYDRDAWVAALDSAGYPSTNQLPKGYKNPAPTGVAEASAAPTTAAAANPSAPPVSQAPPPAAPQGGNAPTWFKGF